VRRQEGFHNRPKFVGNKCFCHTRVVPNEAFLLEPLSIKFNKQQLYLSGTTIET